MSFFTSAINWLTNSTNNAQINNRPVEPEHLEQNQEAIEWEGYIINEAFIETTGDFTLLEELDDYLLDLKYETTSDSIKEQIATYQELILEKFQQNQPLKKRKTNHSNKPNDRNITLISSNEIYHQEPIKWEKYIINEDFIETTEDLILLAELDDYLVDLKYENTTSDSIKEKITIYQALIEGKFEQNQPLKTPKTNPPKKSSNGKITIIDNRSAIIKTIPINNKEFALHIPTTTPTLEDFDSMIDRATYFVAEATSELESSDNREDKKKLAKKIENAFNLDFLRYKIWATRELSGSEYTNAVGSYKSIAANYDTLSDILRQDHCKVRSFVESRSKEPKGIWSPYC